MNYEIRAVDWIKAEALGEPGARHFRIIVYGQGNRACLWIEKGQLLRLCIGIRQLIAIQPDYLATDDSDLSDNVSVHDSIEMEFKVSQVELGRSSDADLFVVDVQGIGDQSDDVVGLTIWCSMDMLLGLADEAEAVCAAGRPICELCHAPISDNQHICPKTNGHVVV